MKRIVLVEDDLLLAESLTHKLQSEGYEITVFKDGEEGWRGIQSIKPDLILLDLIIPTKNGYEILEARKADAAIAAIPVIIISNSGQPVEINTALALGVTDYLIKAQMDPEEVAAKVRACLHGSAGIFFKPRLTGRIVLWVEDDTFLSNLLKVKLEREGCTSLYAENGARALELLKDHTPDVILLDLILPDMNGFEILKKIKADDRTKSAPVIILSNVGQESDIEQTRALGAVQHLVKAEHDPDEIVNEIVSVLKPAKPAQ